MHRLEALLFDLDGTLADTAAVNVAAYQAALAEAGIAVQTERLHRASFGRHWTQFLPELIGSFNTTLDAATVADRKKTLYAGMVGSVRLNTALLALLDSCCGSVRTGLVTTASRANVEAILQTHGLSPRFETIVTGDDVARHKPDPQAYLLAARNLGVAPSQCLAFEDSQAGLRSARSAGMAVVQVIFPDQTA